MKTTDMIPIEVSSIKTPKDVWEKDKISLRSYTSNIKIKETDSPTESLLDSIRVVIENKKNNSKTTLKLDNQSINETLSWLMPEVENAWKAEFVEQLDFEVLKKREYFSRVNELEKEVAQYFGTYPVFVYVPLAYFSAFHGVVLFPSKYPSDPNPESVIESEWDIASFQEVLSEELSHGLFRQSRGEWKEDYVKAIKSIGPKFQRSISLLNEVVALYVKEKLSQKKYPQWILYVLSDKIGKIWQGRASQQEYKEEMYYYIGIEALAKKFSLHQIAMVDDMKIKSNYEININFNQDHPCNLQKQKVFRGKK